MKRAAAEIVSAGQTDEEKLSLLALWARDKIRHLNYEESVSADDRKKAQNANNASDIFKAKAGTGGMINLLFAAMAVAAGYDARLLHVHDRGDTVFRRDFPSTYLLRASHIGVKLPGGWRFYDPANPILPPGGLRWQEENVMALVAGSGKHEFVQTSFLGPEQSAIRRSAELQLEPDGSLTGKIRVTFEGHPAVEERTALLQMSDSERVERVKDVFQEGIGAAELSDVKVEAREQPAMPLIYEATVRVPSYGERTGRRIFFQPSVFRKNLPPRFSAAERKHDVYFKYAWGEYDSVELKLPENFELENPERPPGTKFDPVGHFNIELLKTKDGRKVVYKRELVFGKENRIFFPATAYPQLKKVFEYVYEQDRHSLSIREMRKESPSAQP